MRVRAIPLEKALSAEPLCRLEIGQRTEDIAMTEATPVSVEIKLTISYVLVGLTI